MNKKNKFLSIWCKEQIVGNDDIGKTGMNLLCCSYLMEGICDICPYTPNDIQKDGKIRNKYGFEDVDFQPVKEGIKKWKELNK